jgi:isocitrate lyase
MDVQIMEEEEGRFEAEVAEVGAWWNTDRFRLTKRAYTARDIVLLRGTLRQSYASGEMAKKLWRTLKAHQAAGTASRTFGALDPVQVRNASNSLPRRRGKVMPVKAAIRFVRHIRLA